MSALEDTVVMMLAALLPRHAFVDLETTGLDADRDEVIELGVLVVENGVPVRRISRLFSASRPLPLAIQRLTGLSDADLQGQPRFASAREELVEALRGTTVVAHNAAFESSFLSEIFEDAGAPVLDSCELLHYLYPELESHALESVIRWANVGQKAAHRALQDCEDTFAVVCHALAACVKDGRIEDVEDLLDALVPGWHAPDATLSPLGKLLSALRRACLDSPRELVLTESSAFLPAPQERLRNGPAAPEPEEDDPVRPVTEAEVDAVLGPGGALEQAVPGFVSRKAQRSLAHEVAKTLSDGGTLAVEAGTGTGKSLGYLVPAALFAARNGRKVAVAPHTKTLQDQLIEKDLPRLHRATGGAFGFAVLKGQGNYFCRRRLLETTQVDPEMPYDERAARAYLRAFARRSPDGDLDRLSFWFKEHFPLLPALVAASRSEAATTLGDRCPHYRTCAYHSAVAQAKAADVLVINQALAFAWPKRYPQLDAVVLDEAHEVEDVATTARSFEISGATFAQLSDRFFGRAGTRGLLNELKRGLLGKDREKVRSYLQQVTDAVRDALGCGRTLEDAAHALVEAASPNAADGFGRELRLSSEVRALPAMKPFEAAVGQAADAIQTLAKLTSTNLTETFGESPLPPVAEKEVSGAAASLTELGTALSAVANEPSEWRCDAIALPPRGGFVLTSAPVDVSAFFREDFAKPKRALILASATLTAGNDPWVLSRLGLLADEERPTRQFKAASPFELERQALVVLVTDAPKAHDDAFVEWAAGRIGGLAKFLGGRVLGLFASARRVEKVGERIREELEPSGIEVLRQSRGHGRTLAARQERDFGSVLLGTKSFWQGVDIPGNGVSVVFIDKLPIEPQTRPLVEAREEKAGGAVGFAGFARYRLPRALVLLRQGVGRLIRSGNDRGVVIIADPGHPSYRGQVLAALQGYRVEALPWAQARVRIFQTLKAMGLDARTQKPAAAPVEPDAPALRTGA